MLLIIGVIIGLVLGLTGAGGSVFAVPLLILLAGMPVTNAIGVSLGAVAASTIYGSLRNLLRKSAAPVLWKPGVIMASAGVVSAPVGKWIGVQLDDAWLIGGFTLLAILVAVRMWYSAIKNPKTADVVRAGNFAQVPSPGTLCRFSETGQFELRMRCVNGLLIGGAAVGLLSGLFGVGGGFLIVPLLLILSSVTMAQAVSTSVLMIALVSSSGFVSHLLLSGAQSPTQWANLGLIALGGIVGMLLGQAISQKIANARLQKIFAVCLILVSATILARSFL